VKLKDARKLGKTISGEAVQDVEVDLEHDNEARGSLVGHGLYGLGPLLALVQMVVVVW
jgi:hypothetical protein